MNLDQKLLSIIYASFTNEDSVIVEEVYTADKELVRLRHPMKVMTDELEAALYTLVEHIEFEGDDKIVQ